MIIAASAAIILNKRILLIRRSDYTSVFPGFWACPGGRAEPGETPNQCVIREIKEETGLDFEPLELLMTGIWQDRKLYRFIGPWSGEVKVQPEEIDDWNWFSFEEAKRLKLAFDYNEVIELLHSKEII